MSSPRVQIETVSYNASEQAFEALVSITKNGQTRRFPCAIAAPITMGFEDAAEGLTRQALRRFNGKQQLYSQITRHAPRQRAPRSRFDPRQIFDLLTPASQRRAA